MAKSEFAGLTIKFEGDTTGLTTCLRKIRREGNDAARELSQVERAMKVNPTSPALAARQLELMGRQAKAAQRELDALRAAESQLDKEKIDSSAWTKLQSDIARAEQKVRDCNQAIMDAQIQAKAASSALGRAGSYLSDHSEAIAKAGERMQSVGGTLTRTLTPAIIGAGAASVAAAVEIDTSLTNVKKTVDGTEEQYQALKDAAIEFSKTNAVDASTMLDMEALGAQLGYGIDLLRDFGRVAANLEISTDMGAEQAGTELARFANITKMADEDMERYGSTIVGLGNTMATTESEISSMAMRLASSGTQVGMSEADILGVAAALSSLGVEAEAGGTAVSTIMANIDKAVANGTDGLKAYADQAGMSTKAFLGAIAEDSGQFDALAEKNGTTAKKLANEVLGASKTLETWASTANMSSADFAKAWSESPVEALGAVLSGMEKATAEGGNMSLMLDELGITSLRQTDVMKRLAGNSDLFAEAAGKANKAWEENTALQAEVDNRNESLAAKFEMVKNKAVAIAEEVGGPLADALLDIVDAAEPLIQQISDGAKAFSDLSKEEQQSVLQAVALAAALGPALTIVGKGVGAASGLGDSLSKMATKMAEAGGAGDYFGGKMASIAKASLWAVIVAGVAGTAKGLADLYGHMRDMETIGNGTGKSLQSLFEINPSGAVEAAGKVEDAFQDATRVVSDLASETAELFDSMAEQFEGVSVDNGRLESYAQTIQELTGKTELSAAEQWKLQDAVDKVNDELGTSYSVDEGFAGHLRIIDENGKDATKSIQGVIDAQQLLRQQEAIDSNLGDVWDKKAKAIDAVSVAQKELERETENYNNCTRDQFTREQDWKEALEARAQSVETARIAYEEARGTLNELDATYRNLSDSSALLAAAQKSGQGTLEWMVANSQAVMTALAGSGQSALDFASDLADVGMSAEQFGKLSDEMLLQIAASYDGTFTSIEGVLASYGAEWDKDAAKVKTAAEQMARDADLLNADVQRAFAELMTTTGASMTDFCEAVAELGYSVEDFADLTPEQLAEVVGAYDGTSKSIKGILSDMVKENRAKGGEASSGYAQGIADNAGQASAEAGAMKDGAVSAASGADTYSLGQDFAAGFASGISKGAAAAVGAAGNMAADAAARIKAVQNSNSPSKVTMELGGDFGEGYGIGISDSEGIVAMAAEGIGASAVDSLSTSADGTWVMGYHAAVNYAEGVAAGAFRADEAAEETVNSLIASYRSRAGDFKQAGTDIGNAIWGGMASAISNGRTHVDTGGVYDVVKSASALGYDTYAEFAAAASKARSEEAEWQQKIKDSNAEIREGYREWRAETKAEAKEKEKLAALDERIAKAQAKVDKAKGSSKSGKSDSKAQKAAEKELEQAKAAKEAYQEKKAAAKEAAEYEQEYYEWQQKLKNGDESLNEQYREWAESNRELLALMEMVGEQGISDADLEKYWNLAKYKADINDAADATEKLDGALKSLGAKSNMLSAAGVVFTQDFVEWICDGSEEAADALARLGEMTSEQIQEMVDAYTAKGRAEREAALDTRSLWVNGLKGIEKSKTAADLMLDFREVCLDVKEAVYSDKGLSAAFEKAGVSIEGFALDLQSSGMSMEEFKASYDSMVATVSNGFQAMSRESQVSAADWASNLRNNMAESQAFADNVAAVMAKIPESVDSEAFRKAIMEGGYSQFGQMMMDMATMTPEQITEFVELFNESITEGQQSAIEQFRALAPGEEMMQAAIDGMASMQGDMDNQASDAAVSAAESMGEHAVDFQAVGAALIQGASAGVLAEASSLAEAAAAVVRNALEAAKAEAGVASPAKAWRRELGVMMGKGAALGLDDESENMAVSARALVNGALGAATDMYRSKTAGMSLTEIERSQSVTNNYSTRAPVVNIEMRVDARNNDYADLQRELNKVTRRAMEASGL